MALEIERLLDKTGWRLLNELQQNARLSYTELGQRVGLSLPAVTERIRRMEEAGIITGYHAEVDFERVGLPVLAIVRLESLGGRSCDYVAAQVDKIPEVVECYRVIGDDSIVVQAVATSIKHLTRVIDRLSQYGIPTTSIVRSRPTKRHEIPSEIFEHPNGQSDLSS
jgi:Lrp/AsnC family transcriptional regulator, leucine-responsive regulatory protein